MTKEQILEIVKQALEKLEVPYEYRVGGLIQRAIDEAVELLKQVN